MEGRVVVHEGASRGRGRGGGKGARQRAWAPQAGPYRRGSSRSSGAGPDPRGSGARGYVGHTDDRRAASSGDRGNYAAVVRGSSSITARDDDRNTGVPINMEIVRHESCSAFDAAAAGTALEQRQRAEHFQSQLVRCASELLQFTARHDVAIADITATQTAMLRRMAASEARAEKAEADAATARQAATEALGVAGQAVEAAGGAHQNYITVIECIAQAKIDQARLGAQMAVFRDRTTAREAVELLRAAADQPTPPAAAPQAKPGSMDVDSAPPTADGPSDAPTDAPVGSEAETTGDGADAASVIPIPRAATTDTSPEGQTPSAVINAVAPTNIKQRRSSGSSEPRGPAQKNPTGGGTTPS